VALLTSTAANDAAMYMAAKKASNFLNMKELPDDWINWIELT
jgi:hypothetical protein